jgi:hypothetical protein
MNAQSFKLAYIDQPGGRMPWVGEDFVASKVKLVGMRLGNVGRAGLSQPDCQYSESHKLKIFLVFLVLSVLHKHEGGNVGVIHLEIPVSKLVKLVFTDRRYFSNLKFKLPLKNIWI